MQPQFYSSAAAHTQWAIIVPERPPYIEEPLISVPNPKKKTSFGGDWDDSTRNGYHFVSSEGPIRLRNDTGGTDEDGDVVRDVYYPHETPGGLQPTFNPPPGRHFPRLSSFLEDETMSEGEDERDYDSVHSGEPEGDAAVLANNEAGMEIDMDMEMDSVAATTATVQAQQQMMMPQNACFGASEQSAKNRKRRWDDGSCAGEVAGQPQIANAVGNFAFDGASKRARVGA